MKAIVYVDGFNLYYGALKGTAYKWLNIEAYFQKLLPDDDITAIKYFTAIVDGTAGQRQRQYLLALETLKSVATILGRFKRKNVSCVHAGCSYVGNRVFTVPEEKRTDVNIAVHLLDDAYQNLADKFILVSGDSDLVPALQMIRFRFPVKRISVYVPATNEIRGAAVELRSVAHKDRMLPNNLLAYCQFPATVADGHGGAIVKPATW